MLEEFKEALLNGIDAASVAQRMLSQLEEDMKCKKREIERCRKSCEFIETGLKEPEGTEPRAIAEAYLKQYERDTGISVSKHHYKNNKLLVETLKADMPEGA